MGAWIKGTAGWTVLFYVFVWLVVVTAFVDYAASRLLKLARAIRGYVRDFRADREIGGGEDAEE